MDFLDFLVFFVLIYLIFLNFFYLFFIIFLDFFCISGLLIFLQDFLAFSGGFLYSFEVSKERLIFHFYEKSAKNIIHIKVFIY